MSVEELTKDEQFAVIIAQLIKNRSDNEVKVLHGKIYTLEETMKSMRREIQKQKSLLSCITR